jgi:hypothetical protein
MLRDHSAAFILTFERSIALPDPWSFPGGQSYRRWNSVDILNTMVKVANVFAVSVYDLTQERGFVSAIEPDHVRRWFLLLD